MCVMRWKWLKISTLQESLKLTGDNKHGIKTRAPAPPIKLKTNRWNPTVSGDSDPQRRKLPKLPLVLFSLYQQQSDETALPYPTHSTLQGSDPACVHQGRSRLPHREKERKVIMDLIENKHKNHRGIKINPFKSD